MWREKVDKMRVNFISGLDGNQFICPNSEVSSTYLLFPSSTRLYYFRTGRLQYIYLKLLVNKTAVKSYVLCTVSVNKLGQQFYRSPQEGPLSMRM